MRTVTLFAIAALGAACGEQVPPPRVAPPRTTTTTAADDSAAAEQAAQDAYVYTPIGKRDPFRNTLEPAHDQGNLPNVAQAIHVTPLQKWEIDQLSLVMTVTATSQPYAMVEDPDGRGWSVRLGDFVGKHFGKVTAIRRDEVIVTEVTQDRSTGRVYPQQLPLRMKADDAELKARELMKDLVPSGGAQ